MVNYANYPGLAGGGVRMGGSSMWLARGAVASALAIVAPNDESLAQIGAKGLGGSAITTRASRAR
jgi:hypothetical protein